MKENYLSQISAPVTTKHVILSIHEPSAVLQGPLLFLCGRIPSSDAPCLDIPMLADTGATNSCLSLETLSQLGYGKDNICTDIQYLLTNVTEHNNSNVILGSIALSSAVSTLQGPAILCVYFLVLNIKFDYAIL